MKRYSYPATLKSEDGAWLVTFRDVPEAITQGDTREEALKHAEDALETALSFYVSDGADLPRPSRVGRGVHVAVSHVAELKLALYEAMREKRISKLALARRLGKHPPHIDRLLNLVHQSKIGALAEALAAVGKRLTVAVEDA